MVVVMLAFFVRVLGSKGVFAAQYRGVVDEVGGGAIQGDGVKRGQHADVGHDRCVVVVPAVAFGRHIDDDADMEMRFALQHGLGIFGNLAVEDVELLVVVGNGGFVLASSYALSAAHATVRVDEGLAVGVEMDGIVGAVAHADATADTVLLVDFGFRAAVHLFLASHAATAHADVFQGTAKTGHLVALDVRNGDDDIGFGNGTADFWCLAIFSVDSYFFVIQSFQTVANDDLRSCAHREISVVHGAVEMVDGVGTTARVERIAVGEEGLAA